MNNIHFHKWTKWQIVAEGDITNYSGIVGKQLRTGSWFTQQRECEVCGKVQRETNEV